MTVLVFGQTGQVATELRALEPRAIFLGRDRSDLMDPAACAAVIREIHPDAVINAAAWTAVDKAEAEEEAATVVNAVAPAAMARAAAQLGVPFVQISTDYVFDGANDTPFRPGDPVAPLGAYGRSKLAGEQGVIAVDGIYAILRTSWVFSAHGANFVKTMLRLSETRPALSVVADQIGGPTPARAIAEACLSIAHQLCADPSKGGVYHFSGAPDTSWADFAREVFAQAGRSTTVEGIPTSAYPTPAKRPTNSRLDCSTTKKVFGIDRPDWKMELGAVLKTLGVVA